MNEDIVSIDERRIQSYVRRNRPPIEMRDDVDLGYSYTKYVIELFEVRPVFQRENEYQNLDFARMKYVRTQRIWKLYWMRASGKWEAYEPFPQSSKLEELLSIIDEDLNGCFKG